MADLTQTIEQNAQNPRQAESDGVQVTQHSLRDQIEADRYLASKQAKSKKHLGLRLVKIAPGGSI